MVERAAPRLKMKQRDAPSGRGQSNHRRSDSKTTSGRRESKHLTKRYPRGRNNTMVADTCNSPNGSHECYEIYGF